MGTLWREEYLRQGVHCLDPDVRSALKPTAHRLESPGV